ncbi:MAG: hypothetical protein J6Q42_04190 [Clostridia bacterium]|nr:hypothetical protein [Clostridia bacterium]
MQKKYQKACWATLGATAILTVWRIAVTPQAAQGSVLHCLLPVFTVGAVLALLLWCGLKKEPLHAMKGLAATGVTATTFISGVLLTGFSVFVAERWFVKREMPYPQKAIATGTDKLFIVGLIVCGLVGGVFLIYLSVQWWKKRRVERGGFPLLVLTPVLWSWFRLLRYETSHVSAIATFCSLPDVAVLVVEMLFLLAFARFVSGVEEKPPRFFVGTSLSTGMLCTMGVLTGIARLFLQKTIAVSEGALIIVPDIGFALLAFSMAFGQAFSKEENSLPTAEEQPEAAEPNRESEKPLELDEILDDILRQNH